ncbi:MAG: hypothetical protein SWX82_23325, partial [Cyanobacteriota bacterium]|nr:hypothetical protein [Cyanobacteriota bacterium]
MKVLHKSISERLGLLSRDNLDYYEFNIEKTDDLISKELDLISEDNLDYYKFNLAATGEIEIIEMRESDDLLSSLVEKTDDLISKELDLISEDNLDYYKFNFTGTGEIIEMVKSDDLLSSLIEKTESMDHTLNSGRYDIRIDLYSSTNTNYNLKLQATLSSSNEEVNITSPTSSASLEPGESYTIRWTDNFSNNVKVELYKGSSFQETISSSTLANLPELFESNAERMGEILEMSESDDLLSSLIEKIDEEISEKFGLFSEDNLDYYENQKARVKDFLPVHQTLNQKSLIQKYLKLANLPELSESNAARMGKILEMGESDDLLSSLIEKIDEEISEKFGLFSEDNLDYYEDKKAKIKEILLVNQTLESYQLSSSRYFQPGDFTKLLQEVLNTVDLIFRNGVDAKAFMSSFQQVKAENEGISMRIRGMENKGDGVVVIKIDVFSETNKEKIHREFMQFYDENLRVLGEKYQKELAETAKQVTLCCQRSEQTKYYIFLMNQTLKIQNSALVVPREKLVTLNFEVSSWIEKIDEEISEKLGLFSEEKLDYYENQKAKIKEFLPINQTLESYQLTPEQKSLIQEYSKLANLPELSEFNAERMGEILEIAESDDLLSSWIEKIDEEISEKLGLFSEEKLDYYENQKARIKEFLPINQTLESYQLTPEQKSLIQEYSKLANLPELSEFNAERMGEILEIAESDDLLSSWIEKIDEEISEKLGLFSEEKLDYYENQKARIKEFLPINQTLESYQLTPEQKSLIQEYSKLANLPELSEFNAERMGEILEIAESDDLLSSWIEKIDEEISEKLGLFSEEKLDYYENQKAKIKEFLPINQTLESYQLTPEQKSLIQEYSKLANLPELSEFN